MAVERTEVANIEPLKYILLARKQSFQAVVESQDSAFVAVVHQIVQAQELIGLVAEVVVALRGGEVSHIFAKGAHILIDSHVVVVENDKHVAIVD